MKIAINGTSGLIGSVLTHALSADGHEVIVLKRAVYNDAGAIKSLIDGCDAVINLAGASVAKRWSAAYKKMLWDSRINTTATLVRAINSLARPPFLISASAVGIYKPALWHDEGSRDLDEGFLGRLAARWEELARAANGKVAIFRLGVVLADGGALAKMLPVFRLGLGGTLGDGRQPFCWVHIADLLDAFKFVLKERMQGIFNLVSPSPSTNDEFTRILGEILHRPTLFRVPKFALNLAFGEGAKIMTEGANVYPKALLDSGFRFKFSELDAALRDILG